MKLNTATQQNMEQTKKNINLKKSKKIIEDGLIKRRKERKTKRTMMGSLQ